MDLGTLSLIAAAGIAGLASGLAYFYALRRSTSLLVRADGWRAALLLTLARLAGAAAVFLLVAQAGAAPLLAAFAGFLIARMIAVSRARETA